MSQQQMPWKDAFVQLLEVQGVKGMILICAGGLLLSVLLAPCSASSRAWWP